MDGQPLVTLIFPINPELAEVTWRANPLRFRSPWTQQEQRIRRPGRWLLRYEWSLLSRRDYGKLMALFNRYSDETFKTYDIARAFLTRIEESGGAITVAMFDNLRVNGTVTSGRQLVLDGAPASLSPCFVAGDLIGMEDTGEAYEVAADANSNGSGAVTVELNQFPNTYPADNERVVVSYVPIAVRLENVVTARIEGGPPSWNVVAEMGGEP